MNGIRYGEFLSRLGVELLDGVVAWDKFWWNAHLCHSEKRIIGQCTHLLHFGSLSFI